MKTKLNTIALFAAATAIDTVIKGGGTKPEAKPKPIHGTLLVHARDAADYKVLSENLDLGRLAEKVETVFGLMPSAQVSLELAARTGQHVLSTGLPVDIASKLGRFTIARAWDRKNEATGTSSRGCQAPAEFFVGKVKDNAKFDEFKNSPLYAEIFETPGSPQSTDQAI